jgi:cytochrome oxidase assembly protein ShyY1
MAPVCETRQIKLEYVLQWLVLQILMTIFIIYMSND